jgi:cell division protein FtsL
MTPVGRARLALVALAVVAILFLFVFPTRSYLAQRRQVGAAANDVATLEAQNDQLEQEAQKLQTPEEIERRAREQFNMGYPGEQQFRVFPAPVTTTTVP